ncbi:SIS domain-containing protein [Streptomyces globisporus]|nr:SIS domain-containing protein [Streptomyces globisporus]
MRQPDRPPLPPNHRPHARPAETQRSRTERQRLLTTSLATAQKVADTQAGPISEAGQALGSAIASGRQIWAFGTGHSHMLAEEIYFRAGGLAGVRPVLEPSLMLHEGPEKSSELERLTGLADVLLNTHPVTAGDIVIVASNSGRNAVPVEFAAGARERGAIVIAITSMAHAEAVASRVPDGRKLYQVADIVIDNCGIPGDACIPVEGTEHRTGATSTVTGALIIQAIVCEAVAALRQKGVDVPLLRSNNLDPES